jgi:hypothetical protein
MNPRAFPKTNQDQTLTLTEIRQYYPNQWVLVINPQLDSNLNLLKGEVIYNTSDKQDLYDHLYLCGDSNSALEYTGNDSNLSLLI